MRATFLAGAFNLCMFLLTSGRVAGVHRGRSDSDERNTGWAVRAGARPSPAGGEVLAARGAAVRFRLRQLHLLDCDAVLRAGHCRGLAVLVFDFLHSPRAGLLDLDDRPLVGELSFLAAILRARRFGFSDARCAKARNSRAAGAISLGSAVPYGAACLSLRFGSPWCFC